MSFLFSPSPTAVHRRMSVASTVLVGLLAGCADPALVQVSPNQYRVVKTDKVHFYRTTAELKADAMREADDFAAARGKFAVQIAASEQPLVPGVEFATVKYTFRLVDKGGAVSVHPLQPAAPEAKATTPTPTPTPPPAAEPRAVKP